MLQSNGQAYDGILIDDLGPTHISEYQSFGISPKRAAKMCFKNYSRFSSVTSMLANLNLPTLQERRNRAKIKLFIN